MEKKRFFQTLNYARFMKVVCVPKRSRRFVLSWYQNGYFDGYQEAKREL